MMEAALEIRPLGSPDEARLCARMMANSEPWITLKRGYEESLALLQDPSREVYVASRGGPVLGFLILNMAGACSGYVQTICVAPEERSRGIGSRLLHFAEERVFRESPNVFLCVSDFNPRARALYEKLGYRLVGELTDYVVSGHSEYLMRKTIGPTRGFRKGRTQPS
jgi:ribosomal-protein-alanine N-acetyltransferase